MQDHTDFETKLRTFFEDATNKREIWLNEEHLRKEFLERPGEFLNLEKLYLNGIKIIPDEVAGLPV